MKTKISKILSLLLAISLVFSLAVGLDMTASAADTPVTSIDFEDGTSPFVSGLTQSIETLKQSVSSLENGNKVLKFTGSQTSTANGSGSYYGHSPIGYGLSSDYWTTTARPTKVSFDFKTEHFGSSLSFLPMFNPNNVNQTKNASGAWRYGFYSLTSAAEGSATGTSARFGYYTLGYSGSAMKATADPTINLIDYDDSQNSAAESRIFGTLESGVTDDSTGEDLWNTFTCEYDWSKYNEENDWILTLTVTVTDARAGDAIQWIHTLAYNQSTKTTDCLVSETDAYTFGFYGTETAACIDNISVWSYDIATGATYGPVEEPEVDYNPVINGASIKREGTQDLRFEAQFGDIREDKEVAEYGMIITYNQYIGNGVTADEMTEDTTNELVRVVRSTAVENVAKGNKFYANVGNISSEAYGYRYAVRVYVKYSNGTVDYSDIVDRSVISVAKGLSKFAYTAGIDGVENIVTAVEGDAITWAYDPNTDNGVTILEWLQTNQQAIVDAYNASNN